MPMTPQEIELSNARKLQRQLSIKVERQTKALEDSKGALTAVEAFIRGLERQEQKAK